MIKYLKKHFHLKYRDVYVHAKKLFVFDIGLLILALTMLSFALFFFFWKPGLADFIDIKFSFGGERLTSGEDVTISINYKNRSKNDLNQAELAIHLPDGFIINREKTLTSDFSSQSIFSLGDIKAGASGQVEIHGILYAEPMKDNLITAYLTYIPEEKTEKEQKRSTAIIRVVESVITADISMTDKAFPGKKVPVSIVIKNNGQKTLEKINLKTYWIPNFTSENTEDITLKPDEEKIIKGEITSPEQVGEYYFTGLINIVINNSPITQVNINKKIEIFYPEIGISASIKDSNNGFLEPGEKIPLTISWQNKSSFELKNIKITLVPEPEIVNLATTAKENNLKMGTDSLIIDKSSRTSLTDNTGGKDEFTIDLTLLNNFDKITEKNTKFKIKAIISAELPEMPGEVFSKETVSEEIPLVSVVEMTSEIRYYTPTGDQIGRGPLPPQVGEETKYWSINRIYNGTNDIKDLYFTVKLADGVKLGDRQSVTLGNKLNYNADTNTLSWSYSDAPANSEVGLFFELSVTPNSSQVGKNIKLIESINFSAVDEQVGKNINIIQNNIFNTLRSDDKGVKVGDKVEL